MKVISCRSTTLTFLVLKKITCRVTRCGYIEIPGVLPSLHPCVFPSCLVSALMCTILTDFYETCISNVSDYYENQSQSIILNYTWIDKIRTRGLLELCSFILHLNSSIEEHSDYKYFRFEKRPKIPFSLQSITSSILLQTKHQSKRVQRWSPVMQLSFDKKLQNYSTCLKVTPMHSNSSVLNMYYILLCSFWPIRIGGLVLEDMYIKIQILKCWV